MVFFFKTPNNDRKPAFAKYIESYTSGVILKNGTIKIQLAGQVKTLHSINQPLESDVLDFSPGIEGKAYCLMNEPLSSNLHKIWNPEKYMTQLLSLEGW